MEKRCYKKPIRGRNLTNKKEELERFFSVNLDLLCIADTEGHFTKVNKEWERALGYKKECLEGKKFLDFIHPDDLNSTLDVMLKLEGQEQVLNFINRYQCADGKYKYIEWRSHPYGNQIYAAARDITERKNMEEFLFIEKEKYEATLLSIGDGVISVDENENVTLLNNVAEELTGWTRTEAAGKPFEKIFSIINEQTREKAENPVSHALRSGKTVELANHTILVRKDGTEIAIEDSAAPIRDKGGKVQGVVLVFRDVTEKKKIGRQIEYLSYYDYLTEVYNRRFFEQELVRMDTERNLPLSVIMVDVNGLKLTNDAFGHKKGDELLRKIAEILKKECRSDDIVARVGGDEFAMILPKTENIQADTVKKRIIESVSKETVDSIIVSVAIGYATKEKAEQNINQVLDASENQMYRDKIKTSRTMRNQTLQLIVDTLNSKYEKEQTHTERVSQMCCQIGQALDMPHAEIRNLEIAGFLHDIGKIMIPFEILNKPGKLSDEEFESIKRHPESGYQILKSVEGYSVLAEFVLCHHERWDGNGYPRKIKGDEIPLESRIIAVADAYEAMISGRPYRKPIRKSLVIEELKKNAGTQFDPKIINVFVEKVLRSAPD